MATFTASACQTSSSGFFLNPPRYNYEGMNVRAATYTFGAAQSAGDVIQMVPVPKGALIHDVIANYAGLGGGALTVNVGDGNSATRYNASTSTNAVNVVHATKGTGYSYSTDDTIDVTVGTATSASAGTSIYLAVLYSVDNAGDGTT